MNFFRILLSLLVLFICTRTAMAHTPFMACYDDGDGTITCYGEFSDGASAAGISIQVVDETGEVIIKGRMDEDGEYSFRKPGDHYTVIFDAGPGHVVKEKSSNID